MLGDKVKELRKKLKITQQKLAEIIGVSQSTIGMIEGNKQGASNETLIKLASALNTTVDYLLSDEINTKILNEIEINIPQEYTDKYKVTSRDKKQYLEHMKKATEAFFMNDEFNEEDKKEILDTMNEIFWKAKAKNKRNPKSE